MGRNIAKKKIISFEVDSDEHVERIIADPKRIIWSHNQMLLSLAKTFVLDDEFDAVVYQSNGATFNAYTISKNSEGNFEAERFKFNKINADIAITRSRVRRNDNWFTCKFSVVFVAAIHWLEDAKYENPETYLALQEADLIWTQTDRMKEAIIKTVSFALDEQLPNSFAGKFVTSRHGIEVVRKPATKKVKPYDPNRINIVNAGGCWAWTDIIAFLEAFKRYAAKNNDLKLLLTGVVQPGNKDHHTTEKQVYQLVSEIKEQDQYSIHLSSWQDGKKLLSNLGSADIGLDVNKSSMENFVAYRIRALSYIEYGLPIIGNHGNLLADEVAPEIFWRSTGGSIEGYINTLNGINEETLAKRAVKACHVQKKFLNPDIYGNLANQIKVAARRKKPTVVHSGGSLISGNDYRRLEVMLNARFDQLEKDVKGQTGLTIRILRRLRRFLSSYLT